MASTLITVEDDPTPIVLILATTLRRSAGDPGLARTLASMRGVAVFRSADDPQAATLRFTDRGIHLERGVAADAGVVITADLATLNAPKPPRPKVAGALTHLRLALALGKVLDPPRPPWQEAARSFWAAASTAPELPASMVVVNTETGERLVVGDPSATPELELHGTTHRLTTVLTGNSVLGEDVLEGRLRMVGKLEHLAVLTGRSLDLVLYGAPT